MELSERQKVRDRHDRRRYSLYFLLTVLPVGHAVSVRIAGVQPGPGVRRCSADAVVAAELRPSGMLLATTVNGAPSAVYCC